MGDLKLLHGHLKHLQSRAKNLTETCLALNALFEGEETRLKREDEVTSLRAVYRAIGEQLQRLKETEASAKCGHSQANLMLSLTKWALTAIVSKNNRQAAIADYLRQSSTSKQPFGLVMVCIGPKGLPEDAGVVSISQLARESNQSETEIMSKLQDSGYLLFTEEKFSLLIDRLIVDVRAGKLRLPVSKEKLSEITVLNKPKLRVKIVEVE